jgi:hypothetical protein
LTRIDCNSIKRDSNSLVVLCVCVLALNRHSQRDRRRISGVESVQRLASHLALCCESGSGRTLEIDCSDTAQCVVDRLSLVADADCRRSTCAQCGHENQRAPCTGVVGRAQTQARRCSTPSQRERRVAEQQIIVFTRDREQFDSLPADSKSLDENRVHSINVDSNSVSVLCACVLILNRCF